MTDAEVEKFREIFRAAILEVSKVYQKAIERLQLLQTKTVDPGLSTTVIFAIDTFSELQKSNDRLYFEVKKLLSF